MNNPTTPRTMRDILDRVDEVIVDQQAQYAVEGFDLSATKERSGCHRSYFAFKLCHAPVAPGYIHEASR